jgi:hypothetical protein
MPEDNQLYRSKELELVDKLIDTGVQAPEKIDARWLWDYDYLWMSFEASMRGGALKRNPKTSHYEIDLRNATDPFMNERGIKDIMALLRANVNVILGSTIFENAQGQGETRVYQLCEDFGYELLIMLQNNKEVYEISEGKIMVLLLTFLNAFESNLRKSLDGKALVYAMQAEHRIIQEDATPPAPGLIRKIFG